MEDSKQNENLNNLNDSDNVFTSLSAQRKNNDYN